VATYGSTAVATYESPDGVVAVFLNVGSNESRSASQLLQADLDADAGDPTDFPGDYVIAPVATVQIPNASASASAEEAYIDPNEGLQDVYLLTATRGSNWSTLQITVTDAQLAQYQDQVNQILLSFHLLP